MNRSYTNKITTERDILATSLPPNILVRAYEDRLDLLRCLIIGPSGTPFANAPFLFDLRLPPTSYPSSPPLVFYHSNGERVSPNLYEDGMVCLSLLGTWEGEGVERWDPGRSTILQLLISLQALILVDKPYFTEPGYEQSKGTKQAEVESDAYNENTFVLSRDFIHRAIDSPPSSFTKEIEAFYLVDNSPAEPGVLKAVIEEVRALVAESEASKSGNTSKSASQSRKKSSVVEGLNVLSNPGCASLKTTLGKLEALAKAKGKEL